jgi:hypothetical protein
MKEESIVRENLMEREGYKPYCGNLHCFFNNPRTKWDNDKDRFYCGCGWVSEFPEDFITRYKNKWHPTQLK